jgi:hypothetical protein
MAYKIGLCPPHLTIVEPERFDHARHYVLAGGQISPTRAAAIYKCDAIHGQRGLIHWHLCFEAPSCTACHIGGEPWA